MKRSIAFLLTIILAITILPVSGNADGGDESLFTVEIIPPSNNIGNVGFYHVPGKPGEKITLKAKLTSHIDEPLKIKAVPLNAYSGLEGIFYQAPDKVNSKSTRLLMKNTALLNI